MNDISRINSSYTQNISSSAQPQAKAEVQTEQTPAQTGDQVSIGHGNDSLAKKIIEFPGKVAGMAGGVLMGAVTAPLSILPGAVKGIQEGLASEKGQKSEGLFHFTNWAQNLAIGAGAGLAFGGPIGAAIGAGTAAVFSGVTTYIGEKTGAYSQMVENIETKVDKAISDNSGAKMKVLVQNATEGSIIGAGAGVKSGFGIGVDAGQGVVAGVFGAAEGLAEGILEAGKSVVKDLRS